MNLDKYFERTNIKFKLSDHISEEKYVKNVDENVDVVNSSVKQKNYKNVELVEDVDLEFSSEQSQKDQSQNLFDGYLGEQREVPNPLEYGPNATYRNLREGVVYKKGPDNLWETFVKDGVAGRNGQSAPGGGCGIVEVTKIATEIVDQAVAGIVVSGGGISRTSTLSQILSSSPVTGTKTYPTDSVAADLEFDGSRWTGHLGNFSGLSAISALPSSRIAVGATARVSVGSTSEICFWSGTYWLISDGENINVPSTDLSVNYASTLTTLFALAVTNNKKLILHDHFIGTSSTVMYSRSNVEFRGTIYGGDGNPNNVGFLSMSGDYINATGIKTSGVCVRLYANSSFINVKDCVLEATSAQYAVLLNVTSANVPRWCTFENIVFNDSNTGIKIFGAEDCVFRNITTINCERGLTVNSSERCLYENYRTYGNPIVGMLFISSRSSNGSFGRGFLDNRIVNPLVSGFYEEGFSFDCKGNTSADDASVWHSFVSAVNSSGVQMSAYESNVDYSRYEAVFYTGQLAGKSYDISATNEGFVSLSYFYDYDKVSVGDFVSVETKCRNNIVTNLTVVGNNDGTGGIAIWGFGRGTTFQNCSLIDCCVEMNALINNTGMFTTGNSIYTAPHGVTFDNVKFFGKDYPYTFFSRLYMTSQSYAPSALPGRSLAPEKFFIHNLSIKNCDFRNTLITNNLRVNYQNNLGNVYYTSCVDPQYIHPSIVNTPIYTSSAKELSAFNGFIGQTLICKDQSFKPDGVEFSWSQALSSWNYKEGQTLVTNTPYVFSATSADVGVDKLIEIGTIPANTLKLGNSFYVDSVVNASNSATSTLTLRFTSAGSNAPAGPSFLTNSTSTRSMRTNSIIGYQLEGNVLSAASIRSLGFNNGGTLDALLTCDFTKDVKVYTVITTPTSGINYTVRKSIIRSGVE